jgi:threonylcarbamoyladenosine tRNA methylthiotransferase MtaB
MQVNNRTFCVITLGCKVNLFESNSIINQLKDNGAIYVDEIENADFCIINTCCVTQKAEAKSRNFISRAVKSDKCKLVVVVGCASQLNPNLFEDKKIGIVLGTKYKSVLPSILNSYQLGEKVIQIENFHKKDIFEQFEQETFIDNTRAFIKIQDGCDYMCSYCVIPFVRGRQRSLEHKYVLELIEELVNKNYKEIVLTGVNTAGYKDSNHYNFLNLLTDINDMHGEFRVRISSLEPFQIDHKIIDLITNNEKRFCQHFHLCIQSASDKTIKDMKRKYTIAEFLKICQYIRKKSPLTSITTDLIVGFPTETKEDFNNSIINIKLIEFANMHIFPYSSRPMTQASKLKNIVTDKDKKDRMIQIEELNQYLESNYLKKFINKEVNVLFERPKEPGIQTGHSQFCFTVNVTTKKQLVNQL